MGFHRLAGDALQVDQFVVHAVDEAIVHVQYIGETTGHAGAEVVPGLAQHADETAGHVLATVVTGTLDDRMGAGVAHGETLTGSTGGEQLATGGAVQTGIADDGRILRTIGSALRRVTTSLPPVMPLPT